MNLGVEAEREHQEAEEARANLEEVVEGGWHPRSQPAPSCTEIQSVAHWRYLPYIDLIEILPLESCWTSRQTRGNSWHGG